MNPIIWFLIGAGIGIAIGLVLVALVNRDDRNDVLSIWPFAFTGLVIVLFGWIGSIA